MILSAVCCVEHSVQKVAFGAPLQEHLWHAGTDISVVIEQCVMCVVCRAFRTESRVWRSITRASTARRH